MPSLSTRLAIERLRVQTVKRTDAIDGSYTTGGSPLSAADVGSNCTISVSAHTRVYGSETGFSSVSLSSGTVTALSFSTAYYVFYDDVTLSSTSPTYQASTDAAVAQANYVQGRHPLGTVTTPADGGGGTSGGGALPPSGGSGGTVIP